ncbi:Rieske 2Fe-2S domain-containing protein [Olivibacter sp. SDN3]|uniref:Rieske (2Fe-2S) protein n=1 Tax=Olivibacter sp. SDN3 TaxID=2764720 RepID=UPI0016516F00|nr:Rieske 2Fe-2S domain-containing protein [Olivibacter sp. SDN3]QNL48700.1 Rieske 2Fe-2S domain-containing protein [Olivibacter sp. SDN3]
MTKWYNIDEDLPSVNTIRKIKRAGKHICLINHENKYFATSWRCPHAGADLSNGWCEEGRIVCPYHRHAFDLETGRGDKGQGNYINTYPIEKRDGKWYVGWKTNWLQRLLGG